MKLLNAMIDLKELNYKCPYCGGAEYAMKKGHGAKYLCSNCEKEILTDLFPQAYYDYSEYNIYKEKRMEKDKIIETILNYMCPFFSDGICRGEIRCHDDCIKRIFAKDAVNAILPEGSVVLTKEELAEHDEKVRKEAAEKILQTFKGLIKEPWQSYELTIDDIQIIAEENGVEVK